MSHIGVSVTTAPYPVSATTPASVSNLFIAGVSDWGSSTAPIPVHSVADLSGAIGSRTATNATLYDSLQTFFAEASPASPTAYIGRVIGTSPVAGAKTLKDGSAVDSITVTAAYTGPRVIKVACTNNTTTFTLALTDSDGNTLATSGTLTTRDDAVAWGATTNLVVITKAGGTPGLPGTLAATALTGGTSDQGTASTTQWGNALALFTSDLGPGQVVAPGQTAEWSALGQHALSLNRVAIADTADNTAAATVISAVSTTYQSVGAGPIAFWAGNLTIPGVVQNTTRSIPPSAAIAGLMARADFGGNPNLAAAGVKYPFNYVLGSTSLVSGSVSTYSDSDISTLNDAGINTNAVRNNLFVNYGFVSTILPATDEIFSQLSAVRMRMQLKANASAIGENYVFSEIDGSGGVIADFGADITAMLMGYQKFGALWDFKVNVGPTINTLANLQAGKLQALVTVQFSPFAQSVQIVLMAAPITVSIA